MVSDHQAGDAEPCCRRHLCQPPPWKTAKIGPRPFFLWEFLVDRDGVPSNAAIIPFKTLEQSDFRAPSNLNRWLKDGNEPHLDLLTAVLSER